MCEYKAATLTMKPNHHQLTSNNITKVSPTVQMVEYSIVFLIQFKDLQDRVKQSPQEAHVVDTNTKKEKQAKTTVN